MSRGVLFDYTFDVVQEEECLIWDTAFTNPERWLYEDSGTWISRVVGKMLDTYKE